jgi:hypothetical protein
MTTAEVRAILGQPGEYRTHAGAYDREAFRGEDLILGKSVTYLPDYCGDVLWWCGDDACIGVNFDLAGLAAYKCRKSERSSLDSLLRQFEREWHRMVP